MKLWGKILIGVGLGIVAGLVLREDASHVKPLGTLFINAITMLMVPLVFSSLVVGVSSMQDTKKLGRIGLKTLAIYLITTAIAITVGLLLSAALRPGAGMLLEAEEEVAAKEAPSFADTLVNMLPKNPVRALAEGNMLQLIVVSILLGIAISLTRAKAKPVQDFFEGLAEVMYKLTWMVMQLAPFGVFALIAWVVGKYGAATLLPLAKLLLAVYVGCIVHTLVTHGGAIALIGRLNPVRFFRAILDAQLVAFSTASSSGTLPVTMRCAQENLGVSKAISSFVLPLGATINMDGTAIYQGVCAVFVAQAYGIGLTFANYVTIILTATLASIGTAGVPGAGLIMLSVVLSSVGLPIEGVAIVAGVDRILDMARTTVNVTGDAMTSVLIAKSENALDESVYNAQ